MKTYSVALQKTNGIWITNIGKFSNFSDINWYEVYDWVMSHSELMGFGFYYGNKSNELKSTRNRTVILCDLK